MVMVSFLIIQIDEKGYDFANIVEKNNHLTIGKQLKRNGIFIKLLK